MADGWCKEERKAVQPNLIMVQMELTVGKHLLWEDDISFDGAGLMNRMMSGKWITEREETCVQN